MITRAYAKINLSLNVTGINDNGYHTLESVFLPIEFYDVIDITKSNKMKYSSNKWFILFNEKNTVVKAVNYMKQKYNIKDNFNIKLNKYIPTQAGLGGGSADGAAVIKTLNRMYKLNMTKKEISDACSHIGSDTLFTYYNKPALVKSIGDDIKFITLKKNYYVLLVKPRFGISTKKCYEKLNMDTCTHPNIKKIVLALKEGKDFYDFLGNSLEEPAITMLQDIKKIKNDILKKGGPNALMTGSGSCVFCISSDKNEISSLKRSIKKIGYFVRETKVKK